MQPTQPDVSVYRLHSAEADRRVALLAVWRSLWPLMPGLAHFELGDDPETEIRRNVRILRRRAEERDLDADIRDWLRSSGTDRAAERRHLRRRIAALKALRRADWAIFRIVNGIPVPPAPMPPAAAAHAPGLVPFRDIVDRAVAQAAMRRAA